MFNTSEETKNKANYEYLVTKRFLDRTSKAAPEFKDIMRQLIKDCLNKFSIT